MKRVLFDDAFFNLSNSGVARYCRETLTELNKIESLDYEFILLNRSDKLNKIGFNYINFQEFNRKFVAADRINIDSVCDAYGIDLFISSFFTFSSTIRNLSIVYDLIPEKYNFARHSRDWNSRELGILAASHYVAISENTKADLLDYYSFIRPNDVTIAKPGISPIFNERASTFNSGQLRRSEISKPYLILIGSRYQTENYKNCTLVFEAVRAGLIEGMNIIAVGGEELSKYEIEICDTAGITLERISPNDDLLIELILGAEVLVYPSLYEGFGMPPLEVLSLGIPVITTNYSSLPESVGELSIFIDGYSITELSQAVKKSRELNWRKKIANEGPIWAKKFSWQSTAKSFDIAIKEALDGETTPIERKVIDTLHHLTLESSIFQT